jgi:hypothetical protein
MRSRATEAGPYVATDGGDHWSGALSDPTAGAMDGPFASLACACNASRSSRARGRSGDVRVLVCGGRHHLSDAVALGIEDRATRATDNGA